MGLVVLACMPTTASAQPATPDLIERAAESGAIDNERANLLRVYALTNDPRLPEAYESDTPWRGTLLKLRGAPRAAQDGAGPERREVRGRAAGAPSPATRPGTCDTSARGPARCSRTSTSSSRAHRNGSTINDYAESLEEAWNTEVGAFRLGRPPLHPQRWTAATTWIIDPTLGAMLLRVRGQRSERTPAGAANNPNTSVDGDGRAARAAWS